MESYSVNHTIRLWITLVLIVQAVELLETELPCPYISPRNLIHNGDLVTLNLNRFQSPADHQVQQVLDAACFPERASRSRLHFTVDIHPAVVIQNVIYSGRFVNAEPSEPSTASFVVSGGNRTYTSATDPEFVYSSFALPSSQFYSSLPIRVEFSLNGNISVELELMTYNTTYTSEDVCPKNLYCSSASPFEEPWSACLPLDWRCNGREECSSGLDEKDCCACPTGRLQCVESSVTSCVSAFHACMNAGLDVEYLTMDGCPATRYRGSLDVRGGLLKTPTARTIPISVQYTISLAEPFKLTLQFTRAPAERKYKMSVSGRLDPYTNAKDSNVEIYFIEALTACHIIINLTSPADDYHISYSLTSEGSRGAQYCSDTNMRSCLYKDLCFKPAQKCNAYLDCPNGRDEVGCGSPACGKDEIMCPKTESSKTICYTSSERCDGDIKCPDASDEKNCDNTMCGTHNGTFLCPDKTCIFEQWKCDGVNDCKGNTDEADCSRLPRKVITALVIGLLVCGILIVIAAGCACRLYTHRVYESIRSPSRYESPITQITSELMRRSAPPPYAEALTRSRPFEDVRMEYLAALEEERERAAARLDTGTVGPLDGEIGDTASIASTSIQPSGAVDRDSEPKDDSSDETSVALPVEPSVTSLITPKSDDEDDQSNTGGDSQTRQRQRTISTGSDVSLLSRDSDDIRLLDA